MQESASDLNDQLDYFNVNYKSNDLTISALRDDKATELKTIEQTRNEQKHEIESRYNIVLEANRKQIAKLQEENKRIQEQIRQEKSQIDEQVDTKKTTITQQFDAKIDTETTKVNEMIEPVEKASNELNETYHQNIDLLRSALPQSQQDKFERIIKGLPPAEEDNIQNQNPANSTEEPSVQIDISPENVQHPNGVRI